jgi:hypothetical protein
MKRKSLYNRKRHWYHISTTLKYKYVKLIPWSEKKAVNRSSSEPNGRRICVAPSIEQCITAIPYYPEEIFSIYRTQKRVDAEPAIDIFDSNVTQEGWLHTPTEFMKIGILKFKNIEEKLDIDQVIDESASGDNLKYCREVLKWWQKAKVKRFIKKA